MQKHRYTDPNAKEGDHLESVCLCSDCAPGGPIVVHLHYGDADVEMHWLESSKASCDDGVCEECENCLAGACGECGESCAEACKCDECKECEAYCGCGEDED